MTDTRRPSGEHGAVKAYRRKLDSIGEDGTLKTIQDLNRQLEEKLAEMDAADKEDDGDDEETEEGDDHGADR